MLRAKLDPLALIVFGIAQSIVHLAWSPLVVVLVTSTILGGAIIDAAVQLVVATLSFWVIRLDALRWVVMSLENDFTRFPLSMYNRADRCWQPEPVRPYFERGRKPKREAA